MKMKGHPMKVLAGASCAAMLMAIAPALAQNSQLNNQDKTFIKATLAANLAQVKLGHLAEHQAQAPSVKILGLWLSADDSFANKRLEAIAQKLGAPHQPMLTEQAQALHQKLQDTKGAQFDQDYVKQLKQAEEKAIALFEAEANGTQNHQLKTYATNLTPVLHAHLAAAQDVMSHMQTASAKAPPEASGSSAPPHSPASNPAVSNGGVPHSVQPRPQR